MPPVQLHGSSGSPSLAAAAPIGLSATTLPNIGSLPSRAAAENRHEPADREDFTRCFHDENNGREPGDSQQCWWKVWSGRWQAR